MTVLLLLVLPLPYMIRANIISITAKIQKSSNFKVFVLFSICLMSLQFWDCLARLQRFRHVDENSQYREFVNYDKLASKFYSQRNLYLSGAILYLQICIGTVVTIVKKLVLKETILRDFERSKKEGAVKSRELKEAERKEVVRLSHLLELKNRDVEAVKKQLKGMQSAYDNLSTTETRLKDD
ncbi:uncharacterized protein LODBEIA_P49690 [Lodderomyces beijingensis]|uniref:Endoplasmic reticulum transmembrane protein n=1 Tax=Lodderomyces beijingensis TaxID=1775926 RepID=A0ABP0ZU65_9ASCO